MHPTPFFPPWYFWLFVFSIVLVIVAGVVTMAIAITRAKCTQQVRERELAARLMEAMIRDHGLAPIEIERLMHVYWRLGSFWGRFRSLEQHQPRADFPQKMMAKT